MARSTPAQKPRGAAIRTWSSGLGKLIGGDVSARLQQAKALPMTGATGAFIEGSHIVKRRLTALALVLLATGCSREGEITQGGIYITRSACPQVGLPAGTGDITLFNPANRTDAAALDVSAAITNVRSTCDETGANIVSIASFDVVATRRDAGEARMVVLPYFTVAMQGGTQVVAKRIGNIGLNFPAGSVRAQTSGQATIQVSRA